MGSGAPILVSVLGHAAVGAALLALPHPEPAPHAAAIEITVRPAPPPDPPPPPPPPEPEPPPRVFAASPAPVNRALPRTKKKVAAAGPRPEKPPEPTDPEPEAAPLPDPEPSEPDAVLLPSGDGPGAGGIAERGAGDAFGSGDGYGPGGDGGTPPIPLDATRRARLPYTREAVENHVGGVVLVSLLVTADGDVGDAKLLKRLGHGLDPIALITAKKFKFKPARNRHGQPVAARIVWQFRFEAAD